MKEKDETKKEDETKEKEKEDETNVMERMVRI